MKPTYYLLLTCLIASACSSAPVEPRHEVPLSQCKHAIPAPIRDRQQLDFRFQQGGDVYEGTFTTIYNGEYIVVTINGQEAYLLRSDMMRQDNTLFDQPSLPFEEGMVPLVRAMQAQKHDGPESPRCFEGGPTNGSVDDIAMIATYGIFMPIGLLAMPVALPIMLSDANARVEVRQQMEHVKFGQTSAELTATIGPAPFSITSKKKNYVIRGYHLDAGGFYVGLRDDRVVWVKRSYDFIKPLDFISYATNPQKRFIDIE